MTIYKVRALKTAKFVGYWTEENIWEWFKEVIEPRTYWPLDETRERVVWEMTNVPLVQRMLDMMFVKTDPIEAIIHEKQAYDRSRAECARLKEQLWEARFDVYEMDDQEYRTIAYEKEWNDEHKRRWPVRFECHAPDKFGIKQLDRDTFAIGGSGLRNARGRFYKRYMESTRTARLDDLRRIGWERPG